ncbi:MAG TPA: exonuclease domain-containing protein [Candidatus Paceibacterota bacterium]|nr:exonuclease domain-containing protein [Candidatus Paceibacterota bacterium]
MLAVDVETFGVEPHKNSIYSVGAIDLGDPSRAHFYEECRAAEGTHVEQSSLDFLGLSPEAAADPRQQSEGELVHKFITWALMSEDRTFAGQNVSFDRDFLRNAALRAGHTDWPFAHRTIDTHTLCWMHMVKRGITPPLDPEHKRSALDLDAILVYCGIPEEPTPHNALMGAKSHAEVISRLLYGKKLLPEFDKYDIPF